MAKEKRQIIGIEQEDLVDIIQIAVRNEIETCLQELRFGEEYKDEVWDRKTTANFFRVSPEKISEMFKQKQIPGRRIGREYFFLKSQIIAVLKRKNII